MHFYITLTTNCNQKCRYCYGKCVDDIGESFPLETEENLPAETQYPISELAQFIARDPEPVLIFYGGEPTLAIDKMQEVMDVVQSKSYIVQTNGLLLDRLKDKYLSRLDTILVSLDGDETLTDHYRGTGTYRRVVENLKNIRKRGFRGELIARMTVGMDTKLDRAVKWLLFNEEFPFSSIHWQLDAQFWQKDYDQARVQQWFRGYLLDVDHLIQEWVSHMEITGRVLRMYPFIGVMESLIKGETTKLRCGAGWTEFNIQTDGKITPCPVMAGMKTFYLGDIAHTDPMKLKDTVSPNEPCTGCSILDTCGGRCLYANATKLWGEEGYRLVCSTVFALIESLKGALPSVRGLIRKGVLTPENFDYPKYNSCEIIP